MSRRLTEKEISFIVELKRFRNSIEQLHEVIEELIRSFDEDKKQVRIEDRETVKES